MTEEKTKKNSEELVVWVLLETKKETNKLQIIRQIKTNIEIKKGQIKILSCSNVYDTFFSQFLSLARLHCIPHCPRRVFTIENIAVKCQHIDLSISHREKNFQKYLPIEEKWHFCMNLFWTVLKFQYVPYYWKLVCVVFVFEIGGSGELKAKNGHI